MSDNQIDWKQIAIDATTRCAAAHQAALKRKYPEAFKIIWPICLEPLKIRSEKINAAKNYTKWPRIGKTRI